jgi:hypothetical protein
MLGISPIHNLAYRGQIRWHSMIFDELSSWTLILLSLLLPPLLTLACWYGGRRMTRERPQIEPEHGKGGFWGLLFAAYILCAVAIYSSRFFAGTSHSDSLNRLIQ